MTLTYSLDEVVPYINWLYFYHAWGMSGKPECERLRLRAEADERIQRFAHLYSTRGVFMLFLAHSDGDDIVISHNGCDYRIPCLRQQRMGSESLCLADFVPPTLDSHSPYSTLALFATTVDEGLETDFEVDPYEKMMMQLLADRFAEATAERMHEEVRKKYWGYAANERLTIEEMLCEQWQGIRPAVGYPSLPDISINFLIDQLIDMKQIGIRLTESGAMKPHASVSGMMLSHPQACYFTVGKIGEDQLADYAYRRGMAIDEARIYLQSNL